MTSSMRFDNISKHKFLELFASQPLTKTGKFAVYGASVFFFGSFFWVPAAAWYIWRKKCTTRKRKVLAMAVFLVVVFSPFPRCDAARRFHLWELFASYFSTRALSEGGLKRDKQYIYAVIPHGVFPFGVAFAALGKMNEDIFNRLRVVIADSIHHVPIFRQILEMIGAVSASRNSVTKALKEGSSLGICPGGIAEMFRGYPSPGCNPNEEIALLQSRKGFIKLALEHGVDLVPVYVFGGSKLYHRATLPILEKLSRTIGVSILLFWGKLGLPVPFSIPLLYALGKPIPVAKNSDPSPEEIEKLHSQFCKALRALFDKYKDIYGWHDKILKIV